jgi:hypothetical protein
MREPASPVKKAPAVPAKCIEDFSSDVAVAPDGDLTVKETITVHSDGRLIDHGIVRKFPTHHPTRDGHPEPYTISADHHDTDVRIAAPYEKIARGHHTYVILYGAYRPIEFSPDFDELYWNVTENSWDLPILHAKANVHLPSGATVNHMRTDTALGGGTRRQGLGKRAGHDRPVFHHQSSWNEGLSFAFGFSKGAVMAPSNWQLLGYGMLDNVMADGIWVLRRGRERICHAFGFLGHGG